MASGDDMEVGRTNGAEQITLLVGQKPEDGGDFDDDIFLLVCLHGDHGRWPTHATDGIVGIGSSGIVPPVGPPRGGRGIVGLGGPAAGTGVFGRGGYTADAPKVWSSVGGPQAEGHSSGGIGVHGAGGDASDFGFAGPLDPGAGVLGQGGKQQEFNTNLLGNGAGVLGVAGTAQIPPFTDVQNTGVFGQGGDSEQHTVTVDGVTSTAGPKDPGPGVVGRGGAQGPGTAGGPGAAGVVGVPGGVVLPSPAEGANSGVFGKSESGAGVAGVSRAGFGVAGVSLENNAVFGDNTRAPVGKAPFARTSGCYGVTMKNRGVSGVVGLEDWAKNKPEAIDDFATGVFGEAGLYFGAEKRLSAKGFAGVFFGPVVTWGPLVVFGGPKSAAVPHPDGSHRLLYCMESPESWFEDFGEAKLVKGKATITLDADFAAVAKTDSYHVFVTPYGDSNGLYVTRRNRKGFEVREQNGGRSDIAFSYRIVARRKDVAAERLAKYEPASQILKAVAKQKPGKSESPKKKR